MLHTAIPKVSGNTVPFKPRPNHRPIKNATEPYERIARQNQLTLI